MYKAINRHKLSKLSLTKGKGEVAALAEVADSATALTRTNAGFDEIIDIINNGVQSVSELRATVLQSALTFPAPATLAD